MKQSRRLLVTGAGGFIGSAVVRIATARGHDVVRLVRASGNAGSRQAGIVTADLTSPDAVAGALDNVDTVIHCAASLAGGAEAQARDTVGATTILLDRMRERRVRRLVLVSTMAVYDHRRLQVGEQLDESSPLEADAESRGPYIAAKLKQEQIVRDAGAAIDWRIVRPGLVFGSGRGWFYHLGLPLSDRLWVALAGTAILPLTYVDNCAEAIVAAAEAPTGNVIANVVDDETLTRAAYMRALSAATAPGVRIIDLPWRYFEPAVRSRTPFM